MENYIQIVKKHSEKKGKTYIAGKLVLRGKEYFLNLTPEQIVLILDLKPSEVDNLAVGYESNKFEIKL